MVVMAVVMVVMAVMAAMAELMAAMVAAALMAAGARGMATKCRPGVSRNYSLRLCTTSHTGAARATSR